MQGVLHLKIALSATGTRGKEVSARFRHLVRHPKPHIARYGWVYGWDVHLAVAHNSGPLRLWGMFAVKQTLGDRDGGGGHNSETPRGG